MLQTRAEIEMWRNVEDVEVDAELEVGGWMKDGIKSEGALFLTYQGR